MIAIDGPSGSGKSTLAKALASNVGLAYLDTGAMYRCVGLSVLEAGIDSSDFQAVASLAKDVSFEVGERILIGAKDVTEAIRSQEVSQIASIVAAIPSVRSELVARQRQWIESHPRCVIEGRDIASVVYPSAQLKLFMVARQDVRAKRRSEELRDDESTVAQQLQERDLRDSNRSDSPLVRVADAVEVDTSGHSVEESLDIVMKLLKERNLIESNSTQRPPENQDPQAPTQRSLTVLAGTRAKVEYKPPTSGSLIFFSVCRLIAATICRAYCRVTVEGRSNLPKDGTYIIAPVHRSYVDWIVMSCVTRRRIRFMAKDTLWSSRFVGWLLGALGTFPVHRGSADRSALGMCVTILKEGEPCVLFPEGQRMSGPEVEEVFDGATYVAAKAKVPIVPVGIGGSERVMQKGKPLPRPYKIHIVIGKPIEPPECGPTGKVSRRAVKESSDHLRETIQDLFDQAQRKVGLL